MVSASPGLPQTTALDCVPPPASDPNLPDDVIEEYRDELGMEFSDYFTDAQRYLQCLQAAEETVRDEIDSALEDYERLRSGNN